MSAQRRRWLRCFWYKEGRVEYMHGQGDTTLIIQVYVRACCHRLSRNAAPPQQSFFLAPEWCWKSGTREQETTRVSADLGFDDISKESEIILVIPQLNFVLQNTVPSRVLASSNVVIMAPPPIILHATPPLGQLPASDPDSIYLAGLLQLACPARWAVTVGDYSSNGGECAQVLFFEHDRQKHLFERDICGAND